MKSYNLGAAILAAVVSGPAAADNLAPNWGGLYVGMNAGAAFATSDVVATDAAPASIPQYLPIINTQIVSGLSRLGGGSAGVIFGAQAGWNFQISPQFLVGAETDIQVSFLRGSASSYSFTAGNFGNPTDGYATRIAASRNLDYFGTLRARLGTTVVPGLLLYGTGGLAYGGVRSNTSFAQATYDPQGQGLGFNPQPVFGNGSVAGSRSAMRAGYTVGAGAEWMFAQRWSAKLEYLFYDLGAVAYANGVIGFNISASNWTSGGNTAIASASRTHFQGHVVRLGFNYKLGE